MTRSFLFATWEGGGNIPPMLTLVRRLVARGHEVRLLGDACTRDEAEAAGAAFVPWQRAPSRPDKSIASDPMRDWEASGPGEVVGRIISHFMCGNALAFAQDVLAELARRPADAIVTSEMLLGPMLAGEAAGVPVAALACNIPIIPLPGVPPFGPGFAPARDAAERQLHAQVQAGLDALLAGGLPSLNAARAALGLEPLAATGEQFGRLDLYLCATARAFDFPAEALPPNFRYVGPLLDEPGWAAGDAPAAGERPLVLVALSTTYQAQEAVLRRTLEALGRLDVEAIVTTGPAVAAAALDPPANVRVVEQASHDAILARAAAVVTHCGHGTVMRALAAGVPILCVPMGRDQNDNAARVTARGAGLRLAPSADPAEIGAALARLLGEPGFSEAAARLGRAIAAETGPDRVAGLVEALAGSTAANGSTAAPPMLAIARE
jgi:MGT family glycosyltransferase